MTAKRGWWIAGFVVVALALAASGNSIANGYAYDDNYLIVKAARNHSLAQWWGDFGQTYWPREWGGDGYRPLSVIAYRVQWLLGGGAPVVYHATNIALHVAASVAVLWLASGVLPFAAAGIAASLYAVHPVHVEAIANVVGQSELWVALLAVIASGLYIHGRLAGPVTWRRWVAIASLYLVSCFFKEHAIVLPALLLLAEATVVPDREPLRHRLARIRLPVLVLTALAVAFLWARSRVVLGGVAGFVPYLPFQIVKFSGSDRVLTAIGVAPEWLRLLLWPARLVTEYSPSFVDVAQGPSVAQLPGLLVLAGILGLCAVCWKRSPVTAFGIGWLVLTLLPASNFLVPAGFIVAERTLLLPSVGAMIALASAVPWLYVRLERHSTAQLVAAGALALIIALGITRSVTRNRVWRSNDVLFRQSVLDAPDSYRAHYLLGQYFFEHAQHSYGEHHLRRALELFPDPVVMFNLAEHYREAGWCEPAIPLYRTAFTLASNMRKSQYGLAVCLLERLEMDEARRVALSALRWGADVRKGRELLGAAKLGRDSLEARRARGDPAPASSTIPPPFNR
jgi:protein O-mannosyl-transferase